MVLEVGNFKPLNSLHALVPFYLSQQITIMFYLAIKLYPSYAQQPGRPMVAILYQRTSQTPNILTRVISFGNRPLHNKIVNYFVNNGVPDTNITGIGRHDTPPCNAPNILTHQLSIPAAAEIFHHTPTILSSINFNVNL
ncbi:unnamed protein product [Rhizophagus irregularis]|nr:unnamed protein product [Rhizophagus irregularis]CAB4423210.1 unnamed protein product [Rhizophagus irregularis]